MKLYGSSCTFDDGGGVDGNVVVMRTEVVWKLVMAVEMVVVVVVIAIAVLAKLKPTYFWFHCRVFASSTSCVQKSIESGAPSPKMTALGTRSENCGDFPPVKVLD